MKWYTCLPENYTGVMSGFSCVIGSRNDIKLLVQPELDRATGETIWIGSISLHGKEFIRSQFEVSYEAKNWAERTIKSYMKYLVREMVRGY